MSDILCSYPDREAMLMAYLYDEISPSDHEAFEAHLTTCARCRVELNGLAGVRAQLGQWAPPEYWSSQQTAVGSAGQPSAVGSAQTAVGSAGQPSAVGSAQTAVGSAGQQSAVGSAQTAVGGAGQQSAAGSSIRAASAGRSAASDDWRAASGERRAASWPAWAQAAAAVLVLGVSAGAANINIHYDAQNGLNVRTGWLGPGSLRSQGSPVSEVSRAAAASADVVSRTELTALVQQLRGEIQAASAPVPAHAASTSSDADTIRRVRALLDETERRHEREMALKVAEVMRDVNMQRQADLRKIDQNIDQGRVEVLRNRQMLDYYMQRVSQRQ